MTEPHAVIALEAGRGRRGRKKHEVDFGSTAPGTRPLFESRLSDSSKNPEWPVIEIDEKGKRERKHANFTEFLASQLEMVREAAQEAEQGMELADLFAKEE